MSCFIHTYNGICMFTQISFLRRLPLDVVFSPFYRGNLVQNSKISAYLSNRLHNTRMSMVLITIVRVNVYKKAQSTQSIVDCDDNHLSLRNNVGSIVQSKLPRIPYQKCAPMKPYHHWEKTTSAGIVACSGVFICVFRGSKYV